MVYWSTVILTVNKDGYYNSHRTYLWYTDNDGYYNKHHRTYLWYTGLP